MKAYLSQLLGARPEVGVFAAISGAGLAIAIHTILGTIAVLLGIAISVVTLLIKIREWRNPKR